jgi:hypothetical protein
MNKPQLNYNEYLRYTFSGGIGVISYLYLNPNCFDNLFDSAGIKDSLFLILLSLVLGSLVYAIHRAILFPICSKVVLLILSAYRHVNFDKGLLWPFTSSKLEIEMSFRRWHQRDNPKSFSKNLLDWSAQIHFLYCSVWVLLVAKVLSPNTENTTITFFTIGCLFLITIINHYSSFLFDIKLEDKDKEYGKDNLDDKRK